MWSDNKVAVALMADEGESKGKTHSPLPILSGGHGKHVCPELPKSDKSAENAPNDSHTVFT